jgi:hypothetical protein
MILTHEIPKLPASDRLLLVRLLAHTDAVLWPCRNQSAQAHLEAACTFRENGLPLPTDRKLSGNARAAQLQRLERAGWITTSKAGGEHTSHLRLSDAGDEALRALCGLPGRVECLRAMRQMVKRADAGDYLPSNDGRRFVRETDLAGTDYGNPKHGDKLAAFWDRIAFGIVRGWIGYAIASGFAGNSPLAYRITDAGSSTLASPSPEVQLPAPAADLQELCCGWFVDHAERLEASPKKDDGTLFLIPYCIDWRTANEQETISAGTTPTRKPTRPGQRRGTSAPSGEE